jgi:hypothetical protein
VAAIEALRAGLREGKYLERRKVLKGSSIK